MQTWKWLYNAQDSLRWGFALRVVVKAAILFALVNLLFAWLTPLPALGKLSAYNVLFAGRERLPYGEDPARSYNLSLFQLDAMFASHTLDGAGHAGEYRVLVIGDSSVWGILLRPEETLVGQINASSTQLAGEKRLRAYNLGYPTMSLIKDLMLLDYGMRYDPDLVVWLFTLESFNQKTQLDTAIVQHNAEQVQQLIDAYDLAQDTGDPRFVEPSFRDRTLVGQRRALADLLRLQLYGVAWAVTGIDQVYPEDYTRRTIDLSADLTWQGYDVTGFAPDNLALDVLRAGVERAGNTPVLLVNEPIFISHGANSDLRYNAWFPRWTYDAYRAALHEHADRYGWQLLDLWDALPDASCYTDSPVHLTPACSAQLAELVGQAIQQTAGHGEPEMP